MKKEKIIYCFLFFFLCICPSLGMFISGQEVNSEKRELAEFPAMTEEGKLNLEWFSQAGDYFQEHFAFRNELVTANALVNGKIFGVSTAAGVIQGTDHWLYYKDSLQDYQGTDLLPERSLYNIAHTMAMVQASLRQRNVDFLFTVAPNKNSLYGENMPYYDKLIVEKDGNLERLVPFLEQEQVAYADLYSLLKNQEEVLYHKRDSHWNNQGAMLASNLLLSALKKEHDSYEEADYTVKKDFEGDLDQMLYPLAVTPEEEIYYDKQSTFAYVGEVQSNFDPRISTVNPAKEGSLVMYRDSFGNALLPFLADAYANAYFSRGVPYQLSDVEACQADTVIVERAERFLPEMAEAPPVLTGAPVELRAPVAESAADGAVDVALTKQGAIVKLTGSIRPAYLETDTNIFLRLNDTFTYEAFPMDIVKEGNRDTGGFCLYLPAEVLKSTGNQIEVLVQSKEGLLNIYQDILREERNQ